MASIHEGDHVFQGTLTPRAINMPEASVGGAAIKTDAAIGATKIQQQVAKTLALSNHATNPSAERRVIHTAYGAGTDGIIAFGVGCTVAPTGADSVVCRLLKNGTTVLSADITLDSANANYDIEYGTIDPAQDTLAADDVLEVQVVSVTGTTPKGLFAKVVIRENPAP